jgi:Type II secretion system (T2SS), protein E, N-terminal domain
VVQALRQTLSHVIRHRIFPPACDCPDCHSARKRVWQTRPPIRMHQAWLCSPQCVERAACTILDRTASFHRPVSRPAHRMPLGLLMLAHGYVNEFQLQAALDAQRHAGEGKLGQWLQTLHFATERQVLAALGVQWACPLLATRESHDPHCAGLLPSPLLRELKLAPVRFIPATRLLYAALCDRVDYTALSAIEQVLNCRTVPCLVSDRVMHTMLERLQKAESSVVHLFERVSSTAEMARIVGSYVAMLSSEDVRIVRCGQYIWVRLDADRNFTDLLFSLAEERFAALVPPLVLMDQAAI